MFRTEQTHKSVTLYYWSPFDTVAKVVFPDGCDHYFRVPTMDHLVLPSPHKFKRKPEECFDQQVVAKQWDAVDAIEKSSRQPKTILSIAVILGELAPIPYQQNCRDLSESGTDHYCAPKCIAGCVPVAWAMFASSRKKSTRGNGSSRIWRGVSCWDDPWPSSVSSDDDPSQCVEVSNTIWQLHDDMDTSCDGNTNRSQWDHAQAHFNDEWGLGWTWSEQANVSFDTCEALLGDNQTFVFAAQSEWSAYVSRYFPKVEVSLGKAGHCVVVFGKVVSSYTGESFILVTLGWGKDFGHVAQYPGSKWINFDAFTDNRVAYVRNF